MKKIELKKLDEVIYYDECDCGLPIYYWINEKVNSYYATLSVKYGSIDTNFKINNKEYKIPNGTAHFLEHLKFNEGENKTAHEFFANTGASINAFTTFEYTSYEVFATDNIKENITHLLEYVYTPYFTEELVKKEKGIIIEEVKMGKDRPANILYYGMNKGIFNYNNRKNLITGSEADVKAITVDDIKCAFDAFYHPQNMFLVVTGNFNPYEVSAIVKETMGKMHFKKYVEPFKIIKKENEKIAIPYQEITANIGIPKVKMTYKFSAKKLAKYHKVAALLYLGIILNANFGSTSDFRDDLLEKELIASLGCSAQLADDMFLLSISFESKYPNEVVKMVKEAMKNLSLNKHRLERRIKCNIAKMIYGFDEIEYINMFIQDNIISYGKIIDDYYEIIKSLKLDEAKEIMKYLKGDNWAVVVLNEEEKDTKKGD